MYKKRGLNMRELVNFPEGIQGDESYSEALRVGDFIYISGQVCYNYESEELERESITAQTKQIMLNIKMLAEFAGCSMDDVINCKVYLSDMKYFNEFDAEYRKHFKKPYPTRATVAVAGMYAELDVEIEAVLYAPLKIKS